MHTKLLSVFKEVSGTWWEPREPLRILNGEPGNDSDAYGNENTQWLLLVFFVVVGIVVHQVCVIFFILFLQKKEYLQKMDNSVYRTDLNVILMI